MMFGGPCRRPLCAAPVSSFLFLSRTSEYARSCDVNLPRLQQISLHCNPFTHRLWVPSPLVGEGQDEGLCGTNAACRPLTLALSHKGRGDLWAHGRQGHVQVRPALAPAAHGSFLPPCRPLRADSTDVCQRFSLFSLVRLLGPSRRQSPIMADHSAEFLRSEVRRALVIAEPAYFERPLAVRQR